MNTIENRLNPISDEQFRAYTEGVASDPGDHFLPDFVPTDALLTSEQELQRMREEIIIDSDTGLKNQHALFPDLEKALASVENEPFVLLYLDINNMKKVNDVFDHDGGDNLILRAARYLEGHFSHKDEIYRRYDTGDEIVIIMLGVPEDRVDERVKNFLETTNINIGKDPYAASFSVGFAYFDGTLPHDCCTAKEALHVADLAMKVAKDLTKLRQNPEKNSQEIINQAHTLYVNNHEADVSFVFGEQLNMAARYHFQDASIIPLE